MAVRFYPSFCRTASHKIQTPDSEDPFFNSASRQGASLHQKLKSMCYIIGRGADTDDVMTVEIKVFFTRQRSIVAVKTSDKSCK